MPLYRVQAIFEHDNGLPRDVATCTFHFADPDDNADPAELATDVVEFFSQALASTRSIMSWMATTHDTVYAKAYEVSDTIVEDRLVSNSGPPVATTMAASWGGSRLSTSNVPSEVAVVLSLRDTVNVGTPRSRRTGRVFIGPLNQGALDAPGNAVPRPATNMIADINAAAARLKTEAAGHGGTWCVYSRPFPGRDAIVRPGRTTLPALAPRLTGSYAPITQVWVDDAFDTQRRRGERATTKTTAAI